MRIDNKIITIFIGTLIFFIINTLIASAVLLSDQGTNVKNSTGTLLSSANLTIEIYNASSGGTLILNQTFTDAIINGSWNLMLNASLEFGERYWKNYKINTEDVNFDGNDRLEFQSPLGLINNVSYINFSLINSCAAGSSIRLVNANGTVICETDDGTDTFPANYSNFSAIYGYAINDSLWTLNYSNFSVIYGYAINDSRWTLNYSDYLTTKNYALNDSLWTLNWSNFTTVYGYVLNGTFSSGISWATANNGTLLNYSNALNNTLMQQANWNATNTSYLLTTNQTYAYSLNDSLWTLNWSNFTTVYGYVLNGTFSSGISWATANNGTLLNYSSALNNTLMQQANWNATNTSYTTLANVWGNVSNGTMASWANVVNGTMLSYAQALNNTLMQQANWNATNTSYRAIINHTFYNGTNVFFGINTSSPQNTLNVVGDINATTSVFSYGLNLTTGYGYALNATSNGISWATANNGTLLNYSSALNGTLATWANANNGTLLNYSNALNNTLMQQANWNATNTSYLTTANWNATNTSYYLATNPSGFFNTTGNAFTTFNITTGNFTINNQTTYNLFVVNGTNGRVGIGTNTSQNVVNVVGDVNATTTVWSYGLNLTTGYGYALNATSNGISWATANNGTLLNYSNALNNTLMQQANWNATNTSYTTWAIVNNGTLLNYSNALNNTLMQQANWNATNTSYFDLNKANTVGAFNQTFDTSTLFIDSVSDRVGIGTTNPVTKLQVSKTGFFADYNYPFIEFSSSGDNYGQILAPAADKWSLGYGPTHETIGTSVLTWTDTGNVGIGTTTPQNTLNVVGDANATGTIYAQRTKNLSIGYDYALNGTIGSDTFAANYSNFTTIYGN